MEGLYEITNALSIFWAAAIFLLPVSPLRLPRRPFLPYFACTAQQSVLDGTNGLSSSEPCAYCRIVQICQKCHKHTNIHFTALWTLSGITWVSQYQCGFYWSKSGSGHMQISTSTQTDNNASIPPFSFITGRVLFLTPNHSNSIKALKASILRKKLHWTNCYQLLITELWKLVNINSQKWQFLPSVLMPLPLTVPCFSKIQIGSGTGSPG